MYIFFIKGESEKMNKKIIIIMISLACIWIANAVASEIESGISQYKWGDSSSQHDGFSRIGDKGSVTYYTKPGETYKIGKVSIDKVIYGFYNDQLFGIYLNIDSIEVYDKLLDTMKSQYGLPSYKTTESKLIVYKWKQGDIIIKLKMHTSSEHMKLAFYYHPLSSKTHPAQWEELDASSFHFVPIEKDKKPEEFILFTF